MAHVRYFSPKTFVFLIDSSSQLLMYEENYLSVELSVESEVVVYVGLASRGDLVNVESIVVGDFASGLVWWFSKLEGVGMLGEGEDDP